MAKAILKNYRQSPRKVRLVANTIRGQKVDKAIINLSFVAKRSALPIQKLIESAVANAKNNDNLDVDSLFIKSIQVDQGFTMKRWRPRARGVAHPIRKKTCKVTVVVDGTSSAVAPVVVAKKKAVKTDSK
jgi:large subunit ribosomal protein L22